ncbi:trans-sulfuration enzyme family protein [Clostridium cylindrosporum]|uniref:cysteine-S-conjugate beta-lyase n=1 Tax=Clostridium cylindrosporum DSM 605 TaxID=1121307 RepID=A0A0J8D9E3_CLOCY|nr:aminotransferase class I/II-fold pyridoxal phosphate-dependent enzyme [Clostridium cylindrosporum]KMT20944.1 cystathionine beta-lyase MetC [Clostridium cylindrosporum DSM 605]
MKFGTKLLHGEYTIDKTTGALSVPIYQTSTYHQENIESLGEYTYSRSENPTRKALEGTIASLEGGEYGYAFSSGIAAAASIISIFSAGDHLIFADDLYGGTYRLASSIFNRYGIEFSFVDAGNLNNIKEAIKQNTKAIFLETPSNPLLKITDLKGAIKIAKENNLITVVDNTFMSPYLQRPLELGADIVWHSGTKFLAGHSDVVAGLVVTSNKDLADRIYYIQNGFGSILGPQDSWLTLRGIKTLKARLDIQQSNAIKIANFLESHKNVNKVYYPGLDSHEGKGIHLGQSFGPGAVLSFEAKDYLKAKSFMDKIKYAAVAVSLGGVETIISYPAKMSHAAMPSDEREKRGIKDSLIRVSLGIEDVEDIINDFSKALE